MFIDILWVFSELWIDVMFICRICIIMWWFILFKLNRIWLSVDFWNELYINKDI